MGWKPHDNASYYSYAGWPNDQLGIILPGGPISWSCWARFHAAVTGGDEWIFGVGTQVGHYVNFSRQGGTNTVYSHVTDGGAHSFLNSSAIGADPGNWYHLMGVWERPVTNEHRFAINGSIGTTGTLTTFGGGPIHALFSYDSFIEVAHCAVWDVALTNAEIGAYWWRDPLTVKPRNLRAYWPLSRGAGQRQCAPGPPIGQADATYYSVSGTRALLTDDGPPLAANWPRLELPRVPVERIVRTPVPFIPSAVLV